MPTLVIFVRGGFNLGKHSFEDGNDLALFNFGFPEKEAEGKAPVGGAKMINVVLWPAYSSIPLSGLSNLFTVEARRENLIKKSFHLGDIPLPGNLQEHRFRGDSVFLATSADVGGQVQKG